MRFLFIVRLDDARDLQRMMSCRMSTIDERIRQLAESFNCGHANFTTAQLATVVGYVEALGASAAVSGDIVTALRPKSAEVSKYTGRVLVSWSAVIPCGKQVVCSGSFLIDEADLAKLRKSDYTFALSEITGHHSDSGTFRRWEDLEDESESDPYAIARKVDELRYGLMSADDFLFSLARNGASVEEVAASESVTASSLSSSTVTVALMD